MKKTDKEKYAFEPFNTKISMPGCSYICCCFSESGENYKIEEVFCGDFSRDEIINKLLDESVKKTWIIRFGAFIMNFIGIYLILYPFILLIGMIPFLGAIGTTILVFFAFLFSLITFLFVIACSWIFARPLLAFLIYGLILVLIFISKFSKEKANEKEKTFGDNRDHHTHSNEFLKKFY